MTTPVILDKATFGWIDKTDWEVGLGDSAHDAVEYLRQKRNLDVKPPYLDALPEADLILFTIDPATKQFTMRYAVTPRLEGPEPHGAITVATKVLDRFFTHETFLRSYVELEELRPGARLATLFRASYLRDRGKWAILAPDEGWTATGKKKGVLISAERIGHGAAITRYLLRVMYLEQAATKKARLWSFADAEDMAFNLGFITYRIVPRLEKGDYILHSEYYETGTMDNLIATLQLLLRTCRFDDDPQVAVVYLQERPSGDMMTVPIQDFWK